MRAHKPGRLKEFLGQGLLLLLLMLLLGLVHMRLLLALMLLKGQLSLEEHLPPVGKTVGQVGSVKEIGDTVAGPVDQHGGQRVERGRWQGLVVVVHLAVATASVIAIQRLEIEQTIVVKSSDNNHTFSPFNQALMFHHRHCIADVVIL